MCAGMTTYSPLEHWRIGKGKRIGIVGLGGLGHMGLKFAVDRGAEVTVFTTSPGKVEDAKRMGPRTLWFGQIRRSSGSASEAMIFFSRPFPTPSI
jgi:D-arabinose 1-dehydrogenase-like Zn-dependent alcohol dehydrogenase